MSFRDTAVQFGFVLILLGASFATWALLTGPLGKYTNPKKPKATSKPAAKDDQKT